MWPMDENSTPETDAEVCHNIDGHNWVKASFARRLEHERNKARANEVALMTRIQHLEGLIGYDPIESGR